MTTQAHLSGADKTSLNIEPDAFRVGHRLDAFPCRRMTRYALLHDPDGFTVGMQGLLTVPAIVNGQPHDLGAMGAFYLVPRWRGSEIGAAFNACVLATCYPGHIAGVMAFCEPALVPYYERLGAIPIACAFDVRDDEDRLQPSPQPAVWWPKRIREVRTLDVGGHRW